MSVFKNMASCLKIAKVPKDQSIQWVDKAAAISNLDAKLTVQTSHDIQKLHRELGDNSTRFGPTHRLDAAC